MARSLILSAIDTFGYTYTLVGTLLLRDLLTGDYFFESD